MYYAAMNGHTGCLRVLHEQGVSLTSDAAARFTPACIAAARGHADCLRVLNELGVSLTSADDLGDTPAYIAAQYGRADCLRVLHELGVSLTSFADANGFTLAHIAAQRITPAHVAAQYGHADCLRVLDELGVSMTSEAAGRATPAHMAAQYGHADCLRVLHELGASLTTDDAYGDTPAITAAGHGRADCLRALHELGVSLLTRVPGHSSPAHAAAADNHTECLRVLYELLRPSIEPLLAQLRSLPRGIVDNVDDLIQELEMKMALRQRGRETDNYATPAHIAFDNSHMDSYRLLVSIGGAATLWDELAQDPRLIEGRYARLLDEPGLLNLPAKQAWLAYRLEQKAQGEGAEALSLEAHRDHLLDGLCAHFGVDETTGRVLHDSDAAQARGLDVRFAGEGAGGDGLRREWFGLVLDEILDPRHGLFVSADGGHTYQPSPNAATLQPDHLSYYALLGRLVGHSLYHREPLDVSWTAAFLKAAFGFECVASDLEAFDPELYSNRVVYLRERKYRQDGLSLDDFFSSVCCEPGTFVAKRNVGALIYETDEHGYPVDEMQELKPGGSTIQVTEDNLDEYVRLFAEHRLVGAIREQVGAFREGLAVVIDDDLQSKLRRCCTVGEIQVRARAQRDARECAAGSCPARVTGRRVVARRCPRSSCFVASPKLTWTTGKRTPATATA